LGDGSASSWRLVLAAEFLCDAFRIQKPEFSFCVGHWLSLQELPRRRLWRANWRWFLEGELRLRILVRHPGGDLQNPAGARCAGSPAASWARLISEPAEVKDRRRGEYRKALSLVGLPSRGPQHRVSLRIPELEPHSIEPVRRRAVTAGMPQRKEHWSLIPPKLHAA
jgi:hypothetical protein